MASYIYTSEDGEVTGIRQFPMGKQPKTVCVQGVKCFRDFVAESTGVASSCATWPKWDGSCGVHPKQAHEMMDYCAARGVTVEVSSKTGDAKLTSQKHRAQVHAALELFDRNAGYGDRAPQNL